MKLLILSADDVRQALPMREAIDAMRQAFADLSSGEAVVPQRTHIATQAPAPPGDALFMPSYSPRLKAMGLKVVTLFEQNRALGLPFIQALVMVIDAASGAPVALLDGAALTAIRSGAASGLATDLLARPDASCVAVFGAGVQARTQLEAVCAVRAVRRARVVDVIPGSAERFAQDMRARLGLPVEAAASAAEALADADIVCTATTSAVPVFADRELAAGAHINAMGAYKPHVREIPAETVCRARVVVDQAEAAWAEAGDLILPLEAGLLGRSHVAAELGELVAGRKAGRTSAGEVTLFKSVGVAIQDLAAACRALSRARERGLGTAITL